MAGMIEGAAKRLHDIACRLHTFCTINPTIGQEVGIHALFMTLVNDALADVRASQRHARDADTRARLSAIRAGQLPTYGKRIKLRGKRKVKRA
jgi:hypothetical protein